MQVERNVIPVVSVEDDAQLYFTLRDFAYGCSQHPPEGGFSFLVKTDYLDSFLADQPPAEIATKIRTILAEIRFSPFFVVRCGGDSFEPLMPSHQEIGHVLLDLSCLSRVVL